MNRKAAEGSGFEEKPVWLRNRYLLCLLLFASAFSIKLFLFFSLSEPLVFYKYPFFADQINQGIDIGERILDLSPLYLYGMVLLQKIYGPNWEAMIVFQLLTGCITVVFIFLIGEKVFNRAVGFIAAIILLLYGNLVLFEMTLEPESFVLFFNSLFVLTLLWIKERSLLKPFPWLWLLAGVILGLSIITKANALLFLLAAIVWIFWTVAGKKEKIQYAFLLVLGVSLMVLPVTLRNYIRFHDPVLVTADMGKVFFHGNGPGATGLQRADLPEQGFIEESRGEPDYAHVLFRNTARKITGRNLTPSECSRFWIVQTLGYMKAHLNSALWLFMKKIVFFWLNYEVHDLDSNFAYYQIIRTWPLIPFGLISSLAVLGMIAPRKQFKQAYWPFIMVFAYWLTILIFFNASRYRLPAVPFLSLFAAHPIVVIIGYVKNQQVKKGLLLFGTAVVLLLVTVLPFKEEVAVLDRWQQATRVHYNLRGNFLFRKGVYDKAIEEYQKAVALAPFFSPAYNQMGKSYALLNNLETAEKNFLKVVELSPTVDQGYMNLGFLYELKGNRSKALPFFEKALLLNPGNIKVREQILKLKKSNLH